MFSSYLKLRTMVKVHKHGDYDSMSCHSYMNADVTAKMSVEKQVIVRI
jgi:hypothetical protein